MTPYQKTAKDDPAVIRERVDAALDGLYSLHAEHLDQFLEPARVELCRLTNLMARWGAETLDCDPQSP